MDVVGVVPGGLAGRTPTRTDSPIRGWLVFDDGHVWPVRRTVAVGRCPLLRPAEIGGVDTVFVADPSMSRRHLTVHVTEESVALVDESGRDASSPGADAIPIGDALAMRCGRTAVRWLRV